MHLQNKLGMWLSIRPSRTFCTSSQTGRLPPLCLWLFFCSTRESVEETITELHSTLLAEHFKLEMHRTHTLHRYLRPCSADQVCHSYSYIRLLTQFIGTQQFLASSYLLKKYPNKFHTVIKTFRKNNNITGIRDNAETTHSNMDTTNYLRRNTRAG